MKTKPKTYELKMLDISDLTGLRLRCCWAGCTRSTPVEPLDPGWRCMMVWRGTMGVSPIDGKDPNRLPKGIERIDRDANLCPTHFAALERLLIELPNRDPPKGNA